MEKLSKTNCLYYIVYYEKICHLLPENPTDNLWYRQKAQVQ